MSYLCPQQSANHSDATNTMAKVRSTINPLYTGAAGGYSFYVRKSEQVVRQRKNNSNYGEGASRTVAQQERRVKWGNLVNFYKAIKSWQPKAYETKKSGQTDYNVFMSLNSVLMSVCLTKEMALQGCSVVAGQKISRGSLPKIEHADVNDEGSRGFKITLSNAISSSTTVGQLSADIIANNPQFKAGDNIAVITFQNVKVSGKLPYASSIYSEVTLDTESDVLLSTITNASRFIKDTRNHLAFDESNLPEGEVGMCLIHTRKVEGSLQVSTQSILMNGEAIDGEFTSQAWLEECIDSYGVDIDVPLDPSFKLATISSVTANGSAVSDNDLLVGSQELRVYGEYLYGDNFSLTFNGVEYTPLFRGDGYLGFIIGDNGVIEIRANGRYYMSFTVEDVVVPEELPTKMFMEQWNVSAESVNRKTVNSTNCLQYPYLRNDDHPIFAISIGKTSRPLVDEDTEDWTLMNCSLFRIFTRDNERTVLAMRVTDVTQPAYLMYKGFIVTVFNYTT